MKFYDFQTTTYGKWILAGEHAVVRGHEALVFPIKEKQLSLNYLAAPSELSADFQGSNSADLHLLFWSVFEHGIKLLGHSINQIKGHFQLENSIPVGQGMGASAALCVAMSRWYVHQKLISEQECSEFARELEHLFHGKSSGLDIQGVASDSGVLFQAGASRPIQAQIKPLWYLSSCNQVGITAHCIAQVQTLWEKDRVRAEAIDKQMVEAVQECQSSLEEVQPDAIKRLALAINKACDCFIQWGLVSENLQQHMQHLLENGAIAVKPTGSGGGGYVVSLWEKEPQNLDVALITV